MITDHSRAGWFGASDTDFIVGNWNTATFRKWWAKKLGLDTSHFTTTAMNAGTYYEHAVLDFIGVEEKDKQILIPELLLRVNYDGTTGGAIDEVKTHKVEKPYKLTASHRRQVNVQMYAMMRTGFTDVSGTVNAYGLTEEDYRNFFREIDPQRLTRHPVTYDEKFISFYLPRLEYLRDCLKEGKWPCEIPD